MGLIEWLKSWFKPRPVPYTIEWIRERAARDWEDEEEND